MKPADVAASNQDRGRFSDSAGLKLPTRAGCSHMLGTRPTPITAATAPLRAPPTTTALTITAARRRMADPVCARRARNSKDQ